MSKKAYHQYTFIVGPTKDLLTKLHKEKDHWGEDAISLIPRYSIWHKDKYWNVSEDILEKQVKLYFLIDLFDEYMDTIESSYRNLLRDLLGDSPMQLGIFDMWWELHQPTFRWTTNIDKELPETTSEILNAFTQNGDPDMEDWIRYVLQERE